MQIISSVALSARAAANLSVSAQCRALLDDLHLNVWLVDAPFWDGGKKCSYDLLGDFSTKKNCGVLGRVWVELKVFGASGYDAKEDDAQTYLAQSLPKRQSADPSVSAVLLVVAKVEKLAGGAWGPPALLATLRTAASADCVTLSGAARRSGRGQCKVAKPALAQVWENMEWMKVPETRQQVGMLKHFLEQLQLSGASVGERAGVSNEKLQSVHHDGEFFESKVKRAGRNP